MRSVAHHYGSSQACVSTVPPGPFCLMELHNPSPCSFNTQWRGRAIFTDPSYKHQGVGQGHDTDSRRELGPHTDLLLTLGIS